MAMIDRNFDFATNGTVTANDLHNLIDSATIYQNLITGQQPITSVGTNYELLIADGTNANAAPNAVTVYDLFEDALTAGTYTNANISEALTYGTATGTRLVSTNANISEALTYGTATGTRLVSTNATITTGVIPTLTSSTATFGTTTSTAATITTLNSTTGTISNLSTTLAGDFTISQGTGTIGTASITPAKLSQPFTSETAVASTSGTAIDFTGIPSWAKRITVMISGLSTSGTSPHLLRVGTSSGFVTSSYTSGVSVYGGSNIVNSANNTNGFNFSPTPVDASVACGALTLLNVSGNTWVHTSVIGFTDAAFAATGGGNIALGGLLDRVRITTTNGTDTFDAGSVNIMYEG